MAYSKKSVLISGFNVHQAIVVTVVCLGYVLSIGENKVAHFIYIYKDDIGLIEKFIYCTSEMHLLWILIF